MPDLPDSSFADWPGNDPWLPLPIEARRSFMVSSLLFGSVVAIVAGLVPSGVWIFKDGLALAPVLWGVLVPAAILGLFAWSAGLSYRFTRWQLDDDGLRVRKGRFWRSEVLVPRARVQHLDIERGPIERRFGLATLVVHTAGTRLNALRQPGFSEESAAQLRDALVPKAREHDDRSGG
jgi:membrane protein YdbS with pleckstrin-like domain